MRMFISRACCKGEMARSAGGVAQVKQRILSTVTREHFSLPSLRAKHGNLFFLFMQLFFRPVFLVVHATDSAVICGQKTSRIKLRRLPFLPLVRSASYGGKLGFASTPPALRATSPFRRGYSADRKHSAKRPRNPRSCCIINDRFLCAPPSMQSLHC